MGPDIAVWRMQIACCRFKMTSRKFKNGSIRVNSLSLAVFLVMNVLLVISGDVETNPGPYTRQGQLSKTGEIIDPNNTEKSEIKLLTEMLQSLKQDIADLKQEVKDINIKEEVTKIKSDVKDLKTETVDLKLKVDMCENKIKQKNLLIFGVKENKQDSVEDCETLVREIMVNEFQVEEARDTSLMGIERVHRIGRRNNRAPKPRPILIMFEKLRDRDTILKSGREQLKTSNSELGVSEDFTVRVRKIRKALIPKLKEAKQNGKKTFLRSDKLIIESEMFTYDLDTNEIIKLTHADK
ncbi:hypothetical protein SNE40_003628 [Patella caerulea]|uniref:Uncharacterized protein n=1 Tax=Patella caerulea TaxID=87958 RepID=A0AAN8KA75_PATCE